jgi:hypothetical protein
VTTHLVGKLQYADSVAPGAGQTLVDLDGHTFAAYKPQRCGLVLAEIICPDGVAGVIVLGFEVC